MTGPEHYREAESLLSAAGIEGAEGVIWVRPENLAAAQVHATLALAAATAEANPQIAAYQPHDEESVLPWLDILAGPQATGGGDHA
jgi:hypothetical protein